ncbi:MAG: hypothetical protein A2840_00930 [Candidatus Buchananbacteria bacterium RIFCSPHIGHO2_01_FULL_47_11b]|uniref:Phosphoribosyltransferase domain-containing protein n=1 Tax=Candidatus Buchananbacteria bacterium RIFCSPHIGHO2_01_FULL_47_11b TaxID=1797537 RepID=A0A1G1Y251_9BACT|nr:MAG: hypothetical protein A2840_00930 [Candidatus Buchananbacteria bacterium RIFCSPHIGHO2_01_FULL_47_11b]
MKSIPQFILDAFFPVRCVGCRQYNCWFCQRCITQCKKIHQVGSLNDSWLDGWYAAGSYRDSKLAAAIHALKYEAVLELVEPLAGLLAEVYRQQNWTIDMIVPVPLTRLRRRFRGYNQAAVLAQSLADQIHIPAHEALDRRYHTVSQTELTAEGRQKNVAACFGVKKEVFFKQKNVLLIDDVGTTGATLQACAKACKSAGAGAVYALTVAHG